MFTDTFYPKNDGMSTSTQHLAVSLAASGHQVLIVAPKVHRSSLDFTLPGVQIVWLTSIPAGLYPDLRLASWSPRLHKKLHDFAPEVIHVMSPMPVSLTGMAYAKVQRLPIVMTFHTYFMDPEYLKVIHIDKSSRSKFVEELGWDLAKTVHARADVTIAPTDFVAADLKKRNFKQPILTIPSGVQIKKKPLSREKIANLRQSLGISDDKRVIVSIGRVSQEKNLRGLLRVFQAAHREVPEACLLVVGGGPDLEAVKKYAAKLDLADSVIFTGDVPHEKVLSAGYYALGEFFTTASMSETQGMTSVEAQIYGLPVVAYHSKGLPFVIGQAGVMVTENDESALARAMIDLLCQPHQLEALREKVTANLARFDINHTTKQIVEGYELALTINHSQ